MNRGLPACLCGRIPMNGAPAPRSGTPPDGYTLGLLGQTQLAVSPSLYKLAFDPVKDFAPVSQVAMTSLMLVVHNAVPAKSVKELVALAKAQPGGLTFASGGSGSSPHMAAELFKSVAGLDIRHIPYKGPVVAIPDLVGGRVTIMFIQIAVVLPVVREGKLRALAVTSLRRSSVVPELPTIAASGYPGFEFTSWSGLLAPGRTPAAIVRTLHLETVKALALPDLRAKLAALGLEGIGNSPDEFATVIKSEIPKWAKVIKEASIKPDQCILRRVIAFTRSPSTAQLAGYAALPPRYAPGPRLVISGQLR